MNIDDAYQKVQDEHGTLGAIHHLLALADRAGHDQGERLRAFLLRDLLEGPAPTPQDEPSPSDDVARLLADAEETLGKLRGIGTNFDNLIKAAVQVGMAYVYVRATANR